MVATHAALPGSSWGLLLCGGWAFFCPLLMFLIGWCFCVVELGPLAPASAPPADSDQEDLCQKMLPKKGGEGSTLEPQD